MNLNPIRLIFLSLLALAGLVGSVLFAHLTHALPPDAVVSPLAMSVSANVGQQAGQQAWQQDQVGRDRYNRGDFQAAAEAWQRAATLYEQQGNALAHAQTLSNLSLAWQQLSQWDQAEGAIADSLVLLDLLSHNGADQVFQVWGQALNTQGSLYFALGQTQEALTRWEQAADRYRQTGDERGRLRSQINQAQAMQELGLHRLALDQLNDIREALAQQYPNSSMLVVVHRYLGDGLRLTGSLEASRQILEAGRELAHQQGLSEELAPLLYSLGKTVSAQGQPTDAVEFYRQALDYNPNQLLQTQVELAQLQGLIETEQWQSAWQLWPTIQDNLNQLPPQRDSVYAQINLASQLTTLLSRSKTSEDFSLQGVNESSTWTAIAQLLTSATQTARDIGDPRAETYGLGYLGAVYEQTQQWGNAETLTEEALLLAQNIEAADIAYRWQWQLGRILQAAGKREEAIAAYSESIALLKGLRGDLVATTAEEQFRFRESVEPVYRELVSLLLPLESEASSKQTDVVKASDPATSSQQAELAKARDVIEDLQLAELDNFFQEACLDTQFLPIDQVDPKAAVLYPILLSDRLEMILSLPNQPLQRFTTVISEAELTRFASEFRDNLGILSRFSFRPQSKQLYDWLMRPAMPAIEASQIETLVFVLDGPLRNLPMAVLNDGDRYLIESYRIATAPGLQLIDPQPLPRQNIKALAAGLTEARQGFSALEHVKLELEEIQTEVPSVVLVDQTFTKDAIQTEIEQSSFPVVHIATHGQFGSSRESTFVLTWSDRLTIDNLETLLETGFPNRQTPVELLVLSACETATGDEKAPLGLAGVAVRAGARSTLATLWAVNDAATAQFMRHFYHELTQSGVTKAEALRQAQLQLLNNPQYSHPLYWAPYLLVGNWL
ncbi:MAG: CHAT domain-containing protein [Leptolyngbyaceae cyanobacterium]